MSRQRTVEVAPEEVTVDSVNGSAVLRLEVLHERIPHKDFRLVVNRFTKLIDGISKEACDDPEEISCDISVLKGSLVIKAHVRTERPNSTTLEIIQDAVLNPRGATLKNLRGFTKRLPKMRLSVGDETRDVLEIARESNEISPEVEMKDYGTVEGFLDVLDTRGSPQFTISESNWDVEVKCILAFQELVEPMRKLWRRRVMAHGEIQYNQAGLPFRIKAEKIEDYPYSDVPIAAFRGILSSE